MYSRRRRRKMKRHAKLAIYTVVCGFFVPSSPSLPCNSMPCKPALLYSRMFNLFIDFFLFFLSCLLVISFFKLASSRSLRFLHFSSSVRRNARAAPVSVVESASSNSSVAPSIAAAVSLSLSPFAFLHYADGEGRLERCCFYSNENTRV